MRSEPCASLGLVAALLFAGAAGADDGWEPLVTQDGVSVFERATAERALPELESRIEIDAGIFEVLAVIADVANHTKWMHDCSEAWLVRRESADVAIVYNRTAPPWPVADRDVVLRTEAVLLDPGTHAALRFANTLDAGAPPVDGVVRMPRLLGEYDLLSIAPTRTQVTYRLDVDPGGALPAWAVRRTARDTPLYSLLGLRKQVEATRGAYADFVASWGARR